VSQPPASLHRPRYPRYGRFIGTGVAAGLLAAALLSLTAAPMEGVGRAVLFVFLGSLLALLGALAGAIVALAVETRLRRKAGLGTTSEPRRRDPVD
jgi:hypothetical protein